MDKFALSWDWLRGQHPSMYLADVKTHLANHKPMEKGDENAWVLIDFAQALCFLQEEEEGAR